LNWSPSDTVNNNFSTLVEKLLLRNEDVAAFTQLLSLKNDLAGGVKSHAIMQLFNSKNRYKNDGGFIDFNDMLLLMREATSPSSPLVNILRQRYQVALVDEFQDTDQIQWDIFRNVFTGDNTHRLIVVGDPKQAIYGFRGANVKIYSAARDTLLKDSAQQKYLDTNWRSYPPLISALNELFNENAQWFKDTGAEHKDINSPDKSKVRPRLYSDESNRRPLSLVELPDQITGTRAKFSYSRFVAKEIQHLLNSNIEIVEWRDKSPFRRPLHLGDICILIRSRSELPAIKYALREANIPYTFPKQGGLFATIEAEEWRYLLRAIAAPDDPGAVMSALLTRFFKCVPETLGNYPLLPVTHPLKMTFAHWHHLAENRLWALLFQSIFADTGILERVLPTDDGERIVTNYQHLVQILHEQAVRTRGNIDDMILFLDNKCLRKDDENTDLQRIETERRKVKIMTMHGSKGLEFEIVFIAGGFTNSKTRQSSGYTTDQGRKYVFNDDKEHKEAQKNEEEADSRRLFYVALTRAKYKLYIPYISNQKGGKGALGSFIATAINSAWPDKNKANNDRFAFINIENNSSLPIWKAPVDDASGVILLSTNDKISNIDESSIIIPEINPEWGHRITRVHSFSSLSEHAESASETPELQFSSANNLTDDKQTITDDATDSGIKDNDDLPHGAQTGTLLHAILEEIDYPAVLAAADYNELLRDGSSTRATILNLLNRYPLPGNKPAEDYYEKIAHIVWQTLRTPMPFLNNTPLAALTDRRHELEFWLPANSIDITIPDVTLNHNYLSGFIDLIFRYEGRYYILDWKSNWSPTGDYSRNALDVVIHNNKYDLQYSIYSMALDKFLRMSLTGYNPVKDLGGVCYLFLRGVGDGENGIYYVPASDIIITDINKDVSTRLMNKIAEVR
jgi:exodeoxyribonuclease V beta subunit